MFIVEICTRNKYLQRHLIKFLATMSRVNSFSTYLCGRHEESFEKVPVAKRKCSDRKWPVETKKWILHLSKPPPPSPRLGFSPASRQRLGSKKREISFLSRGINQRMSADNSTGRLHGFIFHEIDPVLARKEMKTLPLVDWKKNKKKN